MKDQMEAYFQRIQTENAEMKEEIEIEKRKKEEAKKERDHFQSMYEYMQLKGVNKGPNTSRRDRTFSNDPEN